METRSASDFRSNRSGILNGVEWDPILENVRIESSDVELSRRKFFLAAVTEHRNQAGLVRKRYPEFDFTTETNFKTKKIEWWVRFNA